MSAIAMLLAAAAAAHALARWTRLPAPPLLILGGIALNASGLTPPALLQNALILGVAFLLFIAGLELNPRRVGAQGRAAARIAIIQFLALGGVGLFLARLLAFPWTAAAYLGLALTASSTLVVVRILRERGQMFEPFARLVLGVLLLQDLFVTLLVPALTRAPDGFGNAALGTAAVAILVAVSMLGLRRVSPRIVSRLESDQELLLIVVLGLLFTFIGASRILGLPVIVGAFLAGVSLASFPADGIVRSQLAPIGDFFLAVFFTALGGLIGSPSTHALVAAAVLTAAVVLLTPPLVTVLAERAGLSARAGIESGLLLAQTSEFSLVVGLSGLLAGHISNEVFTVIALVTMVTMILTPLIGTDAMTWRLMRLHPSRAHALTEARPANHVVLLGCGETGMPLLETLLASGEALLVVDDDAAITQRLVEGGIDCVRGDASDPAVLDQARIARARLIISTVRRTVDNLVVLERARGVPTIVRVFDPIEAERISRAGGQPIVSAIAAAHDFLRWFDEADKVDVLRERRRHTR
ncbi:MAG: cation:proton antiporter [Longimicrobiales bacterium]